MRSLSRVLLVTLCFLMTGTISAQVLLPEEIQEAGPHRLQLKYLSQLRAIGSALEVHKFPYNFYFSRVLDVSEQQQRKLDQRSIRFERFQGETVLIITGNYYAAYSDELMNRNARAKRTLEDIVMPMMQIGVPYFVNDDTFDGFAIEISHHVRRKVMGISSENAENVMYLFPRAAAQHLVNAKSPDGVQAALLESKIYINADGFNLWVNGERPSDEPETLPATSTRREAVAQSEAPATVQPTVSQKFIKPTLPARLITPKVLEDLKAEYSEQISRMERDLADQIHFAGYVPTQFVAFHEGAYLQLSMLHNADVPAGASRYKLAAFAFDDHIAHLVRPVAAHFQDTTNFDGVVFSLIVKPKGDAQSVAVEFYLPLAAMRNFTRYDVSGQELLDSGLVLINGERATLNLQIAESK
jgi:hypothetical protein